MAGLITRRRVLVAGAAGIAGGVLLSRNDDHGRPHNAYFARLSRSLAEQGLARPTLVIDRTRLLDNIRTLNGHLQGGPDFRIVAKSLPSADLIRTVMTAAETKRLMVFHQAFLNHIADTLPATDTLLGKPMPVAAAARFYQHLTGNSFAPDQQVQWLVDTQERLKQYAELASGIGQSMRINVEIDVGLHRGGLTDPADLIEMLRIMDNDPNLQFSGLMGYDPHVPKIPGIFGGMQGAFDAATGIYQRFIDAARGHFGNRWTNLDLTMNTAGSPTYQLHKDSEMASEVSVGSALVKPTDFDIGTLADHVPACFIATPVIKAMDGTHIPGLEKISGLFRWWDPNRARSFFIYGGYWKATPVSPPGLKLNPIYGRSSNQELLNGSASIPLQVDDYVFLRPTQSESVFLQFGNIAVFDGEKISDFWPVFPQIA